MNTASTQSTLNVVPAGTHLGARIEGLDLSKGMAPETLAAVRAALAQYGVISFPRQTLTAQQLHDFSAQFGSLEINVGGIFQEPGLPQVMILSNITQDGKPIGIGDAGQDWHTDMSYSGTVAYANVLHALKVPQRNGQPLGGTLFADMAAAYDALPQAVRERIDHRTATHDFEKFWEMMRRERNSPRPPLSEAQRRAKPPVSHPMVLVHPVSGRRSLYANPGYAMFIDGMPRAESDALLEMLFAHQVEERFIFKFNWTEGDVLMWDNLRVIHKALADYGPTEHRMMKRCQVMADKVLPRGTAGAALSAHA